MRAQGDEHRTQQPFAVEFFCFFLLCVELHVYTAPSSPYESCDVLRVRSTESGLRSECRLVILGIEGGRLGLLLLHPRFDVTRRLVTFEPNGATAAVQRTITNAITIDGMKTTGMSSSCPSSGANFLLLAVLRHIVSLEPDRVPEARRLEENVPLFSPCLCL